MKNYDKCVSIIKPVNISITVAAGVASYGDPSVKTARHTTSVRLYSDLAGIINVYTL